MPLRVAALALCVSLGACGAEDPIRPPDPPAGPATISVVSGGGGTDTIEAALAVPLTILVQRDGKPRAGVVVRFQGEVVTTGARAGLPSVYVHTEIGFFANEAASTSDSAGRVRGWIKLGQSAGPAALLVSIPESGATQRIEFTVTPGAAKAMAPASRFLAATPGDTLAVRIGTVDRVGNLRADPVTMTYSGQIASVGANGRTILGSTYGRAMVRARFGLLVDSTVIAVVPAARLTIVYWDGSADGSIAMADADGEHLRLVRSLEGGFMRNPRRTPNGRSIVYNERGVPPTAYVGVDTTGATVPITLPPSLPYTQQARFSDDGQFIYFAARATVLGETSIWRTRADGTALEQITRPPVGLTGYHIAPSLSRDGTLLAYCDGFTLAVRTLATGATVQGTSTGICATPEVSPDGRLVAYYDGNGIMVTEVESINARRVAAVTGYTGRPWEGGIAWCPDSSCVIARDREQLVLVMIATGDVIPIAGTSRYFEPSLLR